jgi:hypothetical protein
VTLAIVLIAGGICAVCGAAILANYLIDAMKDDDE